MITIRYLNRIVMIAGLLLLVMTSCMAAIQVEVDGRQLSFNVPPMQMNGRTMVPLRGIFEALGARVDWNASTMTITATSSDTDVELIIGNRDAMVNGQTVHLDTPAMIVGGSTMVPLRFVSEALGADVKWFEATQTVSITTKASSGMGTPVNQGNVEPSYSSGPVNSGQYQNASFSSSELDEILAPIALYPDPLIAQILPAATYPDQLADADNLISQRDGAHDIDQQNWDVSVKAIAYYPSVLRMMVDKPDWTTSVGQAYVNQPDQVMRSIQRLRSRARSYGYLSTNQYQRVYLDSDNIRIVPVQSEYIYVPEYDPQIVFIQRRNSNSSNLISFGLGLLIGSWLNRDVDWGHNRVFYHGWNGGGWIGNSRSHVRINDEHYVNRDFRDRPIEVDRNVRTRDLGNYRSDIRKNAGRYKLPESNQPNNSGTWRNRNTTPKQPAPRNSNQGSRSNRNNGITSPSDRGNTPAYVTPSKPGRSDRNVNKPNSSDNQNKSNGNTKYKSNNKDKNKNKDRNRNKDNSNGQ